MEIVFGMVVAVMPFERTCVGVQSLGQIRSSVFTVRLGVDRQLVDIVCVGQGLAATVKEIGQRFERLRGCVRPRLSAPPATRFL